MKLDQLCALALKSLESGGFFLVSFADDDATSDGDDDDGVY